MDPALPVILQEDTASVGPLAKELPAAKSRNGIDPKAFVPALVNQAAQVRSAKLNREVLAARPASVAGVALTGSRQGQKG